MSTVLGLALTATDLGWVLADTADHTVLDHDALELQDESLADAGIAGAAARGAQAIARAGGFEVDRIRLTWTADGAGNVVRLRAQLGSLGFDVEAVPMACATRVLVRPEDAGMPPLAALAFGAALADVDPGDVGTVGVAVRTRRRRPGRILAAALGVAAASAVGVVFLTAGSVPRVQPAASAAAVSAAQPSASDPGWISVTAPSDGAAEPRRRVVTETAEAAQPSVPVYAASAVPAQAPAATGLIAAAPEPAAVPHLPSSEQQHLPGAQPEIAPLPGPADPSAAGSTDSPAPAAGMILPPDVLTALP